MTEDFSFGTFKRHYYRVRDAYKELAAAGDFTYRLRYDGQTELLSSKLDAPPNEATVRFVTLMRRFLDPREPLYCGRVWGVLRNEFSEELTEERIEAIESLILRLDTGSIRFEVNGEDITAEHIYKVLAEAEYFGRDERAREYLRGLVATPPVGPLIWWQFYNYNVQGFALAAALFSAVLHVEGSERFKSIYGRPSTGANHCIYCLKTEARFTSEEHIVSESLGNYDYLVLPVGYVCDVCNNGVLSKLDNTLIKAPPVAFLRVLYVPYDKAGKLPKASFGNMTIERTGPQAVRITPKDRTGDFQNIQELEDGRVTFNLNLHAGGFNPKKLARSLYKIALGLIAFDLGQEQACSSKYDLAREFIHTGRGFPNRLLMCMKALPAPHGNVRISHDPRLDGTLFFIDIYGLVFLLNLETTPVLELNEQLGDLGFEAYALGDQ
jgi:hypothetical protein